jgi:hypothetical protein
MNDKTKLEIAIIKKRLSIIFKLEISELQKIKQEEGRTRTYTEKEEKALHIKKAVSELEAFLE